MTVTQWGLGYSEGLGAEVSLFFKKKKQRVFYMKK